LSADAKPGSGSRWAPVEELALSRVSAGCERLPDAGRLLETLRAGNLGHGRPGHHKVIVREARHYVNMQMEQQVIERSVVLEHNRPLGAVQRHDGGGHSVATAKISLRTAGEASARFLVCVTGSTSVCPWLSGC
jgi:hypothetical protein